MATASPQSGGTLVVQGVFGVPNPNPTQLTVELEGLADGLDVRVFTKALVLAVRFHYGNMHAGWNPEILPTSLGRLPNGLYYVQVQADRGSVLSQPRFTRFMILR